MPGAGLPEQAAAPESARLPRGVEIRPAPIPEFDGENAAGVQDAFAGNLNLVSGGNVTTDDGQTIQTPGILGSAQDRIAARLEEINATGQALAGEKEQFGGKLKGLRGPRAVRETEREKRRISQADNQASATARNRIREQQGRIRGLCEKQHISKESQAKYDHIIVIEEYLNANPDSTDLQSIEEIQESLKGLNLTNLPRERIEDRLAGAAISAQGYEEYKTLKIGQGEGDNRTKGLRDFEADLEATEAKRNSNAEALKAKLQEARDKAKDWEDRNAKFKREDTPEQRRLKQDHALGQAVAEFLGKSYVPDAARLAQVGEELSAAGSRLESHNKALADIAEDVSGRAADWLINKAAPWALRGLRQRVDELDKERYRLSNPTVRLLTQPGAPKALVDMVRKVQARGFDMAAVPPRERVLAETVTALLGKGVVTVEDSSQEESATAGAAPEIAGPEDGDSTPDATDVIPEPAREPEQSLTPDQLADLAMTGGLTVSQLLHLPEDPVAQRTNDDLIDPRFFGGMENDLRDSLEVAEKGGSGISREGLSKLVIDALRRTAYCLEGNPPDQPVTFDDFKNFVDKAFAQALATNPADPDATKAKRLLAVAETAYKLRKG